MANFLREHKLVTIGGAIGGGVGERWQIGLRMAQAPGAQPPVDQASANLLVAPIRAYFNNVNSTFSTQTSVDLIKVAAIGIDGKYPPGTDSFEAVIGAAINGANANPGLAPQLSWVVTLATDLPRGKGHLGRVYLPTFPVTVGPWGQIAAATADGHLAQFRTMINAINGLATGFGVVRVMTRVGSTGPATDLPVTSLKLGLTADTQRRRRRSIPENYRSLAL